MAQISIVEVVQFCIVGNKGEIERMEEAKAQAATQVSGRYIGERRVRLDAGRC